MVLKTDSSVSRRGFRLSYQVEDCGGEITTEGEISSISRDITYTNLFGGYPGSNLNCVWNITAPPNKLIVLKSTVFRMHWLADCRDESVEVFDIKENGTSERLAKLCGNLSNRLPVFRSSSNKMTVHYSYLAYLQYQNRNVTFKANVLFTYGS